MYNKVFLIGNLTKDPELRYTPSGIPVVRFTVAVNRPSAKSEKNEVDFINVVAWRRLAEICGEYLKKGRPVSIEGRLQIRPYEKDGEKKISRKWWPTACRCWAGEKARRDRHRLARQSHPLNLTLRRRRREKTRYRFSKSRIENSK